MAYSSLKLTNDEILKSIATVAGFHRTPSSTNWDSTIQQDVREIIRSGLRRFYNPPPIDGVIHTWRFLERKFYAARPTDDGFATGTVAVSGGVATFTNTVPTWAADGVLRVDGHALFVTARTDGTHLAVNNDTIVIASGTTFTLYRWRFPLPTDFAEFIGGVSYDHDVYGRRLRSTSDTEIRLRWAATFQVGQTNMYYVEPRTSSTDSADWYFNFWPAMDESAGITATYRAIPLDNLDTSDLFLTPSSIIQADPIHAQTMLEAILASAEEFYAGGPGNHTDLFMTSLRASVMHDRQSSWPVDFSGSTTQPGKEFYLLNHVPTYDTI